MRLEQHPWTLGHMESALRCSQAVCCGQCCGEQENPPYQPANVSTADDEDGLPLTPPMTVTSAT
jgi:hypothetical protein